MGSSIPDGDDDNEREKSSKYLTSWWTQFATLLHRALKKNKSGVFAPVNIVKTIAVGIVVGIVFFNQKYTEQDAQNVWSYFFFTMLFWVMQGLFEALFSFPQDRVVIQKERATASYRLSSYFMAMTVADLPVFLLMPFIYMTISYWMVAPTLGFVKYLCILLIALLSVMTGQAMGFLVGAAFDDKDRTGGRNRRHFIPYVTRRILRSEPSGVAIVGPIFVPICVRIERGTDGYIQQAGSMRRYRRALSHVRNW